MLTIPDKKMYSVLGTDSNSIPKAFDVIQTPVFKALERTRFS